MAPEVVLTPKAAQKFRAAMAFSDECEEQYIGADVAFPSERWSVFVREDASGDAVVFLLLSSADGKNCTVMALSNSATKGIRKEAGECFAIARQMNGGRPCRHEKAPKRKPRK